MAAYLFRRRTTAALAELSDAFGLLHRHRSGDLMKQARSVIEQNKHIQRRVRKIQMRPRAWNPSRAPDPSESAAHARFDRQLLGYDDVVPGMIGAIQVHRQLLHWHPHLDVLITCVAWTPERRLRSWPHSGFGRFIREMRLLPQSGCWNLQTFAVNGVKASKRASAVSRGLCPGRACCAPWHRLLLLAGQARQAETRGLQGAVSPLQATL